MSFEIFDQGLMKDALDADPLSTPSLAGFQLRYVNLQAAADLCIQVIGEADFLDRQFFWNRCGLAVYRFTALL